MWKKAFILLLSVNVLILTVPLVWYSTLPRVNSSKNVATFNPTTTASVNVDVGDTAVNAYLKAAIAQKPEISRILSYANVNFQDVWSCDIGINLDNRVVPFHVTFLPNVEDGNIDLQIVDATMNNATMTSTLENIIELLPLPNWVSFDAPTDTITISMSDLPAHQVKVQALDYSQQTHLLTLLVATVPNFK